jgi:molybdopterin/thiamine biosynthesis adenylyltransferase
LIPELESLGDFEWHPPGEVWALHCRLRADVLEGGPVPRVTSWYLCADATYPAGEIGFYPAKEGGLTATFPHQAYNGPGAAHEPWRSGKLCLTTDVLGLGRFGGDTERREPRERMAWHVRRALEWLSRASRCALQPAGMDFELPSYLIPNASRQRLVFAESTRSFERWRGRGESIGIATLARAPGGFEALIVTAFSDLNGDPVYIPSWRRGLAGAAPGPRAAWMYLQRPVALEPWQAPVTWKELREHLQEQGVDLRRTLRRLLPLLRGAGKPILLLGFSIPLKVEGDLVRAHWIALELPECPQSKARKGRRERGLAERDLLALARQPRLRWLATENWDSEELAGRGRLPEPLRDRRTVLLGAGALGSVLGEMLVRGGLHNLSVLDGEKLIAGNLVRHLLTIDDLGKLKASSLAARLNRASPHADIVASPLKFPQLADEVRDRVATAELVLDCTASDDVLLHLERSSGPLRTFVVLCLGIEAKRLYAFAARGSSFPRAAYVAAIRPHLEEELKDLPFEQWPREGVGCWNPVFPARVDAIWLLAAAAIQYLVEVTSKDDESPRLTIFERVLEGEILQGVRRTEVTSDGP